MHLTAETFQQVARALSLAPADIRRRRSSRRLPLRFRVTVVRAQAASGGNSMFDVEVTDASPQGLGLVCASPLEVGADLIIRLPGKGTASLTLRCQVMRCETGDGPGRYRIGSRFISAQAA